MVHCWDAVWGGTFIKLNELFPENELFDFIARWNVEYLSGGKCPHEDPNDHNYCKPSPAGYTMINGWGSARYNAGCAIMRSCIHEKQSGQDRFRRVGKKSNGIPFCFDRANNPVDKFATRQFDKWKLEIYNICGCIKFTMCFLYEVYVERCLKSFGFAKGIGKKRNGG